MKQKEKEKKRIKSSLMLSRQQTIINTHEKRKNVKENDDTVYANTKFTASVALNNLC